MRNIVVIAHDLRSSHNIGSLLRTCDGLGVNTVYLTGHTPYPTTANDPRLPHIRTKVSKDINKTALGAENYISWEHHESVAYVIETLKQKGYELVALEQSEGSISLLDYHPSQNTAVLLGREVEGIDAKLLQLCDTIAEIPMLGKKESFNVVQAAAISLFHIRTAKNP